MSHALVFHMPKPELWQCFIMDKAANRFQKNCISNIFNLLSFCNHNENGENLLNLH